MVRIAWLLVFLLQSSWANGQGEPDVYLPFDLSKPASFPGGDRDFLNFWKQNLYYPPEALQKGIGGCAAFSVVVEKDGSLTDLRTLRSIGGGCSDMIRKIIEQKMPRWNPAEANGHTVRQHWGLLFYFHPFAGRVFFLGTPSFAGYPIEYEKFARLKEDEYYKVNISPIPKPLPLPRNPLQVPDEARAARINAEVEVEYTISADGLLTDVKVLNDPGFGCGKAALEFASQKKYWVPRCYYDTCITQKKTERIMFCTDTAALLNLVSVFQENEAYTYTKEQEVETSPYDYLRYPLKKSGWVELSFTVEKDGLITSIEFEPTPDTALLHAAKMYMQQNPKTSTYTLCNFPCRVRLHRYLYFCVEDQTLRMLKVSPLENPVPLANRVYQPEEVDKPITLMYSGDLGFRYLHYGIWEYPGEALRQGIEGEVVILVNVTANGSAYPKIFSDIGGGCGEEALRIVGSKYWLPARINGYPVESTLMVPIRFRLPR
ncbi:MAG: energy transducer TonB [Saprospiraceae bacterium]|jgi:hypothetical protein|nr:energy transducer TonB [Saprospiraceae bacterium]